MSGEVHPMFAEIFNMHGVGKMQKRPAKPTLPYGYACITNPDCPGIHASKHQICSDLVEWLTRGRQHAKASGFSESVPMYDRAIFACNSQDELVAERDKLLQMLEAIRVRCTSLTPEEFDRAANSFLVSEVKP